MPRGNREVWCSSSMWRYRPWDFGVTSMARATNSRGSSTACSLPMQLPQCAFSDHLMRQSAPPKTDSPTSSEWCSIAEMQGGGVSYIQYLKIQKIQPFPVSYLYLRYIFSQLLLMVSVSKYLKDTEDTAPRVSVS